MMQYIRPFGLLSCLLLGMVFPLQLLGVEQTVPEIQETIPEASPPDRFDAVEAPRNYLSGKITRFANDIDRFFGGDRHYQESNASVIQLNVNRRDGYGGNHQFDPGVRLNLRLPVTEGRLRLLIESDPEKNITEGPTPAQGNAVLPSKIAAPKGVGVAVRVVAAEENVWHFSTDAGVKFPIPVQPFVRARGSYAATMGEWGLKAAESVYWFNSLGAGETTQLDLEHIISNAVLFRASSNATWLNEKKNVDLRQDLSVYHTLNDRTTLLYQASVIGISNPQLQVTDYVALLFYRYRLHKEWLFFEASPQLHFPVEKDYKVSPAFNMRLEILLDDSR